MVPAEEAIFSVDGATGRRYRRRHRSQTGEATERRGYFAVPTGNLTGTCGDVLTTLGLPSE
jgi:hypothetical protein